MPTSPRNNSIVQDTTGQYHLLVEREQVSFTGGDCNKIGTSYKAFNNQPGDACLQPLGSCLDNQIMNIYEDDIKRVQQGKNPKNILKKYSNSYQIESQNGDRKELKFPVEEVQTTLIRLEINTKGRVSFVQNIAKGEIESVEVKNNNFESMNDYAKIETKI